MLAEVLGLAQVYTATAVATAVATVGLGLAIVLTRRASQLAAPEQDVGPRSVPIRGIVLPERARQAAARDQ